MNSCTNSILLLRMDLHYCIFRCLYFCTFQSSCVTKTLNQQQRRQPLMSYRPLSTMIRDYMYAIDTETFLGKSQGDVIRLQEIFRMLIIHTNSHSHSIHFNGIQVATLMKIQEISQTKITLVQTLTTNSILVYLTEMLPCIMSSVSCLKKSKTLLSIPWG